MTCTTWWIMASISFFVGLIMNLCSWLFMATVVGTFLALLGLGFVIAGWVLWTIGLVSYIRRR